MNNSEKIIIIIFIAGVIFIGYIAMKIVKAIFRFIFSLFKSGKRSDPTQSEDWLTRAQAKQEIRFQNAMPPLQSERKPIRRTLKEKRRMKNGFSPTGWKFNEETKKWDPPDYL